MLATAGRASDDVVWWVDVEAGVDEHALLAVLRQVVPELDAAVVADLCQRDEMLAGAAGDPISPTVSLVGWSVDGPSADTVVFQQVEVLAVPGLVVSYWHRSQRCTDTGCETEDGPVQRDCIVRHAERRWASGRPRTAGDLATALAEGLTAHYHHGCRLLEDRLQQWETTSNVEGRTPTTRPLENLLALANQVRRRLAAFEQLRAHGVSGDGWFEDVTDTAADERATRRLATTHRQLELLFDSIRSDMELATMRAMQRQTAENSLRNDKQARFEERLGWVTALLLVPTLITGFFGANTRLPGGGSWHGFEVMISLIVLSSLAAYFLLVHPDRSGPTVTDPSDDWAD